MNLKLRVGGLALIAALGGASQEAFAIGADTKAGSHVNTDRQPNSGSGWLWLYTEANNAVINGGMTHTGSGSAPAPGGNQSFLPPIGSVGPGDRSDITGKTNGTFGKLESTSTGNVKPIGKAHGFSLMSGLSDGDVLLQVGVDVTTNLEAAGTARDPWYFDPGPLHLNQSFEGFELSASSGARSFIQADMSSDIPGFTSIYSLSIFAPGGFTSANDLVINFASNPLLGLNDGLIAAELRSSFGVSGNTATMNSSVSFGIDLNSSQSFSVDYGVSADAQAAPEPAPFFGLALGGGLLGLARRRLSRECSEPNRGPGLP